MRAYDIIYKKREGKTLSKAEINYLIDGYSRGKIPDYQLSAWTMAVYFKGMDKKETAELTMAMVNSGDKVHLDPIKGQKIDKHSTGGVGDTTTLVLAPLVAAAGVPVAKLSGRGLGHTGGTIDKLESIPGFNTGLTMAEFIENVNKIGIAVAGQTANLTPADKKLYALRDVTATVESIPLIASSIMSKKIAGGANGIVLDVKTGNGAFMKELKQARKLAKAMVKIGEEIGRQTTAVISNMNQPLGYAVGNSIEVKEAVSTLKGKGPVDLQELCLTLGANMLLTAEKANDIEEGKKILLTIINSGQAYEKYEEFITAQGGDPSVIDENYQPQVDVVKEVVSNKEGYIHNIDALQVGLMAMELGAGREKKGDKIDPEVGLEIKKKNGSYVKKGEPLAVVYINQKKQVKDVESRLLNCFTIKKNEPSVKSLIYEVIK
ncbi:MAG: pyrimidine-nucleoside phosphorylase [Halothermotrichaceae bacterium]